MTEKQKILNLIQLYKNDFPLYAESVLKLVDKKGNLIDFNLNPLQQKLHEAIEKQKRETGKVRVIVLKSRKLGISTYTAARNIHLTAFNKHKRSVVITHQSDSTSALFKIYKRFHENLPPFLQPKLKSNNAKEFEFGELDSSIKVATAGSKETGRGETINYLHASEIGFWSNDFEIAAGLMQAVPEAEGTEIIIESTPNGIGNLFHSMWEGAVSGDNSYLPIFFGWNLDPDCSAKVPKNFELSEDEKTYAELWDLSHEQIFWRRTKIKQMGLEKFTQEYPISAAEAFRSTEGNTFIPSDLVIRARKNILPPEPKEMPLILGVDVASSGGDKTCIVWRKGNTMEKYQKFSKLANDEVADQLINIIRKDNPAKVFIDSTGGYGSGVAACMRIRGYDCEEIHFSNSPIDLQYANKRAEMFGELKNWLQSNVSIPDTDEIELDLTCFGYKHNNMSRLVLESKEDVKKRFKRSPDIADALALTFSYPVGPHLSASAQGNWEAMRNRTPDYAW
ncbi:hypothetical protein [Methylobacter sp. YRD-M1]|uniref:hypothetical protein n=1 Tax=Methylobacter sp. YRD-M1 TaxID=2911520 RepID=UPI00227A539E|nr:hypothetical protein [Methylobacter sp. YRD-M1]WAK01859.1 hypothetical protein LZ558_18900 [Methylobacter sp. YRD-M1]